MNSLVLLCVIAAAVAAPLPDEKVVAVHGTPLTYGAHALLPGAHGLLPGAHGLLPAAHGLLPGAVTYAAHSAVAPVPVAPAAVSYAAPVAPAAVSYAAPVRVELPPAEVKVPVTQTHVEVPVHQKVHYGTQSYVAGATTSIHKPALSAPAIAPPSTLLAKVSHNAPELTIQRQEVPVDKFTPNFVETPYHAGTIVKYTEPEVREVKVPTPYAQPVAVPQPIAVPQPVAVPHAVPVRQEVHSLAVHGAVPAVYTAGLHQAGLATVVKAEH